MWAQAGGMDSHLPRTCPQLLSQTHRRRAPGSSNTPVHTCSKQGTHMLNSGSPRYKRLGVGVCEHLESRLLPKSIGISVSPPTGPHLRLWRSQQQVRIPTPPTHSHRGGLLFHNLSQRLELGNCYCCLCLALPPTGAQPYPTPSKQEGAHILVWGPFPWALRLAVGGTVASQKEKKA